MITLQELADILKANENLKIEKTDEGLLISDMNEAQVVPTDLINFVKIYEKDSNIIPDGDGYIIKTETFSAQSFLLLLMSVFGAEYSFEVTGAFELRATKKADEKVQEELFNQKSKTLDDVDFVSLAEAIDSDKVEIEIHEDGLKISCIEKTDMAKRIDEINSNLLIEITDEAILVSK